MTSEEEDTWNVEAIVGFRKTKARKTRAKGYDLLISWQNCSPEEDTWEHMH